MFLLIILHCPMWYWYLFSNRIVINWFVSQGSTKFVIRPWINFAKDLWLARAKRWSVNQNHVWLLIDQLNYIVSHEITTHDKKASLGHQPYRQFCGIILYRQQPHWRGIYLCKKAKVLSNPHLCEIDWSKTFVSSKKARSTWIWRVNGV